MDIPDAVVYSVTGGLVAAVGILWKTVQAQLADLKSRLSAADERLRTLEADRVADAVAYGHELKAVAGKFSDAMHEVSACLTEMRKEVRELNRRPCMHEHEPHDAAPRNAHERTTEIRVGPRPSNGG